MYTTIWYVFHGIMRKNSFPPQQKDLIISRLKLLVVIISSMLFASLLAVLTFGTLLFNSFPINYNLKKFKFNVNHHHLSPTILFFYCPFFTLSNRLYLSDFYRHAWSVMIKKKKKINFNGQAYRQVLLTGQSQNQVSCKGIGYHFMDVYLV